MQSQADTNARRHPSHGSDSQPDTSTHLPAGHNTPSRAITCFTPGTVITTIRGKVPVEFLREGDRVLTRDRGFQPILWKGSRRLDHRDLTSSPELRPVLVKAGALGDGLPEKDMMISPRHRLLTTDSTLLASLGESEALVEALALVGQPGILRVSPPGLTYVHLLFESHEVIVSDNTWSESFHLGQPAATALLEAQHTELLSIFPGLRDAPDTSIQSLARVCLTPH